MNKSKIIALSAISTAMSVIILVVGSFIVAFELSVLLLSSLLIMLPLSKESYLGAFLTVIATSILTLVLSGFRFGLVLPYFLFFGLHPIVNFFQTKKNLNKWLIFIIKDVWFVLTLLLMQWLIEVLAVDVEMFKEFLYPVLIFGGALFFILYDYMMKRFQTQINLILARLKL